MWYIDMTWYQCTQMSDIPGFLGILKFWLVSLIQNIYLPKCLCKLRLPLHLSTSTCAKVQWFAGQKICGFLVSYVAIELTIDYIFFSNKLSLFNNDLAPVITSYVLYIYSQVMWLPCSLWLYQKVEKRKNWPTVPRFFKEKKEPKYFFWPIATSCMLVVLWRR